MTTEPTSGPHPPFVTGPNTNLICDGSVIQSDGLQHIVPWYGGPVNVNFTGVFAGATVSLVCCTKLTPNSPGDIAIGDWISLWQENTPGQFSEEFLAPCMLSAIITGASGATSIRAIVNG